MDAENEHFRFYTFMRLKLGDNGKKILQDLQAVFGAKCVAKAAITATYYTKVVLRESGGCDLRAAPNRWNLKDLNAA
nr:hypothetical protein BaRGS_034117 [Batillaria attramentaria]